jgi:hypothetical protein
LQDDFDDLCETLTDRLGQPSQVHIAALQPKTTPVCSPALETKSAKNAWSVSGLDPSTTRLLPTQLVLHSELSRNNDLAPVPATDELPGKIEMAKIETDPSKLVANTSSLAKSAEATELVQLAGELQTLAEMTSRLRSGLDRLLAMPNTGSTTSHTCSGSDQVVAQPICIMTGKGEIYERDKSMHESLHRSVEKLLHADAALSQENVRLSSGLDILLKLIGAIHHRPAAQNVQATLRGVEEARHQVQIGSGSKEANMSGKPQWIQERLLGAVEELLAKLQHRNEGISQSPAQTAMLPVLITTGQKAAASTAAALPGAAPHEDIMVLSTSLFKPGGVKIGQEEEVLATDSATGRTLSLACHSSHVKSGGSRWGGDCINEIQGRGEGGAAANTTGPDSSINGRGCNGTTTHTNQITPWAVSPVVSKQMHTSIEGLLASVSACQPAGTPGSPPSLSSTLEGTPPSPPGQCQGSASPCLLSGTEAVRAPTTCSEACKLASSHVRSSSLSQDAVGRQAEGIGMRFQIPLSSEAFTPFAHGTQDAASAFVKPTAAAVGVSRYCV